MSVDPSTVSQSRPDNAPTACRTLLWVPALAAAAACGTVGVEAYAAFFCASYFTAGILAVVVFFWSVVSVLAVLALSALALPLILLSKGRARTAIVPSAVAAGTLLANTLSMGGNVSAVDVLGREWVTNVWFSLARTVLYAALVWVTILRAKRAGYASITLAAIASVCFASAASVFMPKAMAGATLVLAPFPLFALTAILLETVATGWRRAAALAGVVLAETAALAAMGVALGVMPQSPIGDEVSVDPARAAMVAGKPNVVIAVVDTMRADHTSLCGYEHPTTPNLLKLASDSRFFPYGESVDSWTLPAHASMFTGKYPRQHGARNTRGYAVPLAPSQLTLASCLQAKGYNTAGIAANTSWLCRRFGINQGFSYYYDLPRFLCVLPNNGPIFRCAMDTVDRMCGWNGKYLKTCLGAETVTGKALSWISGNKEAPFFLFLNYMDAHSPYAAAAPFDQIDGPGIPYNYGLRLRSFMATVQSYLDKGTGLAPAFREQMVNQYDGSIAYADYWIGRLIDELKAEGLYDNTLLVVLSDHGEFLGEHQLAFHGVGLYEGGVRIPILVKYPNGAHAGEVDNDRVSIIDVFATVLQVLDYPLPPGVPAMPLGSRRGEPIYAEEFENGMNASTFGSRFKGNRTALYERDYKYMSSTVQQPELYGLVEDPGENHNLVDSSPEIASLMDIASSKWQKDTPTFDGTAESAGKMSPEDMARFRALGYIGGN